MDIHIWGLVQVSPVWAVELSEMNYFCPPRSPVDKGVDIIGPGPAGRGKCGPTTIIPCRNVSLPSQVIPMSALGVLHVFSPAVNFDILA